jgi:hypothetical protein
MGVWTKECIKCHRCGTRGFEYIPGYGWQCVNERTCDARLNATGVKLKTPRILATNKFTIPSSADQRVEITGYGAGGQVARTVVKRSELEGATVVVGRKGKK